MSVHTLNIAMVAGETSGDLLGSLLLQGLREYFSSINTQPNSCHAWGIGGHEMQKNGFDVQSESEELAVFGYADALYNYPRIWHIRQKLQAKLLQERPDVFIGIDAPDFNLGLEERLKKNGIPTVHFVCPSIWAWRLKRVHQLEKSASHVLCIYPFEPALLNQHGIPATFVGHPLANAIALDAGSYAAQKMAKIHLRLHDNDNHTTVALMPGSRASEITHLLPRFLQAAQLMVCMQPELNWQFIIPVVPQHQALVDQLLHLHEQKSKSGKIAKIKLPKKINLKLIKSQSHVCLAACDVVLVASGTATLEAALFKRPMVIAYALHPFSYHLMRRQQLQPWVGLPNILAKQFLVPELLQHTATPEALANEVLNLVNDKRRCAQLVQHFTVMHNMLCGDTSRLTSCVLLEVMRHAH